MKELIEDKKLHDEATMVVAAIDNLPNDRWIIPALNKRFRLIFALIFGVALIVYVGIFFFNLIGQR